MSTSDDTAALPPVERTAHPSAGDETTILRGFLAYQRDTLRLKAEGLDATQLDTPLAPSTLTLGGLLGHLTFVEQYWFGYVLSGRAPSEPWASADWDADPDWEMSHASGRSPAYLRGLFDAATAESDQVVDAVLAEDGDKALERLSVGTSHGDRLTLRWILLHMIEEYARHNGHADLIRESVDGTTGE